MAWGWCSFVATRHGGWTITCSTLRLGRERRLSNLKPGSSMEGFDLSRDGKRIVFARGRDNSDIVLIDLKGK